MNTDNNNPLILQTSGHTFTATVNRPDSMNAVNFALMDRLEQVLDQLENSAEVRLFVLTGSHKSFISGGDLREFHQLKKADEAQTMTKRMIRILARIENLSCWTLAALNGSAYGGGWEIAAAFDFRVARRSVKIGFTQGKFYLPPGWGGTARLIELVGKQRALYWLAAQKVLHAENALQSGFLDDLFEDHSYDEELGKTVLHLTRNDRTFIEYLKKRAPFSRTEQEIEQFSRFWESHEHDKRVDAFLNRK